MNATHSPETLSAIARPSPAPISDPYADSERSFEIVNGKVVDKNMGLIENLIAKLLYDQLAPFCRDHQLGWVIMETPVAIPGSGNHRKPDVAFVSYPRWPADRPIPRVNAWPVVPDLTVEVISHNDKAFEVIEKLHEYFAGGVRQVWQVYSNVEQVWVYDSPTAVRILAGTEELIGAPVAPGFHMRLADLFQLSEPGP